MPESFILQQVIEDPLLAKFELGLRHTYFPLGFPLEVRTNSREVLEAASGNWDLFLQSFDLPPIRLELGVKESVQAAPAVAKSTFFTRGHLMFMIIDPENFFVCDFDQAFSFAWVTPALASDPAALRYHVLTPVAVMMAQCLALAPLHAALISRNGCGVALYGDSLAGKSTLAYACARAGWTYISDDGTFLVRDRSDRYAIGNPHSIRFREDARELFPELAERLAIARPNGKMGIEVFTRELPIAIAPGANIEHVVLLNRDHRGSVHLSRYPKDQLQAYCERHVSYGTSEVQAAITRCHRRLLDARVWELSYEHLDDAIRRLERLVDSGD